MLHANVYKHVVWLPLGQLLNQEAEDYDFFKKNRWETKSSGSSLLAGSGAADAKPTPLWDPRHNQKPILPVAFRRPVHSPEGPAWPPGIIVTVA